MLLIAIVIYIFNFIEQRLRQVHAVVGIVKHRDCLVRHRCKFRSVHGLEIVVEHARYALKNRGEIFKRQNGVIEVGHGAILDNCAEVLVLLLDAGLDGWYEIRSLDFVEGRKSVRILIFREERILAFLCHGDCRLDGQQGESEGQCC